MAEGEILKGSGLQQHLLAPAGILLIVFLILVPLPPFILDFFFTFSIIFAMAILIFSTYLKDPVEFSVYPTILLLATLYRLSLNISSTRLILLRGEEGIFAAGKVIGAFGDFVVGGNYVIGIIVFIIIIAIQYIVVAQGASRSAEVMARFTLDKMPGKQLSIDADLNAGLITEKEALERRRRIEREAEFFGTMDGAIKFTSNEAKVSIIITLVNIIGGLLIGLLSKGMDISTAARTYIILTVGDGLMAAIPSLLITISGGVVTTRAASDFTLGEDIYRQLFSNYRPVMIAGSGILFFALIPGLPKIPFLAIGMLFWYLGYVLKKEAGAKEEEKAALEKAKEAAPPPEKIENLLKIDLLALEIGFSLIPLVDAAQGGTLLQRVKNMRKQLALELGIIVPPVRIRDNLQLSPREYNILLKGVVIARGEVFPDKMLAINPGNITEKLKGLPAKDPAFGLNAFWIAEEEKEKAQMLGFTLVDAATVIATHLTEIIRANAAEILGRQETQQLIDNLAATYPKVVEELIPNLLTLGNVQKVLQNLLREKVSIIDLRTILETLADYAPFTRDLNLLTEMVRQKLSRSLVKPYLTPQQELPVLVLGGELESVLQSKIQKINNQEQLVISPDEFQILIGRIKETIQKTGVGLQPILLTPANLRYHLKALTERYLPEMTVLSAAEIPPNVKIVTIGIVE